MGTDRLDAPGTRTSQPAPTHPPTSPPSGSSRSAEAVALAGTDQQGIWFTDDDTWAPLGADGSIVFSFAETRSGALLAGTRGHGILRSDDDGTTWTHSNSGLDDVYVHCLLTLADGSILAGTGQGLSRSTDDGQTWQPYAADIAGHRMFAIHELANGTLAVGSYAHLWVGREETWRQVDPGLTPDEAWSVHFTGNTIYAGTKTGVLASTDDGDTFTNVGGGSVVFALTESHDGTILAGGDDGVLRGPDWNPVGHLGRRAYCIFETEPGTLLAGTLTEGLYRFRDGVWAPHPEGPPHWQVYGIVRSQTGRLIACTGAIIDGEKVGGVFTSDDNGDTWCEKLAGRSYYAITQTSDGAVYAGGRRCYISVSTDDGDRWALLPLPLGQEAKMYSLFADHDNRLFVGAGGQLLRSDDHGHHWDVLDEGIDGVSVYDLGQRHDALLAAATSAGVFTSADGGDTWTAGRLR